MKCPNCGTDNPEGSAECAHCALVFAKWSASLADAPAAASARAPEQGGPGLGTLLLLAAVLAGGWGAWRWMSSRPAAAADSAALLAPAPYRKELLALETVLYKDALPMSEDQQALSSAAEALGKRLPPSSAAAGRVEAFRAFISGYGDGLVLPPNARDEWMRRWEQARSDAFGPAAWLHESAAPQASEGGAMDPQEALLALQRSAKTIGQLLDAAEKETVKFGETAVVQGDAGAADKKRLDAWRNWVADWLVRVDPVFQELPSPERLPVEVQEGGLLLHRITVDMRAVPDSGPDEDPEIYLPDKAARDAWLSAAGERLKQAEAALQKSATAPS